jgi:hypothetical protein
MKYAILIYETDGDFANRTTETAEGRAYYQGHGAYCQALIGAGVFGGGFPLYPPKMGATTVIGRGGKPQIEDGPYADTKEQLGGLCIIEAENLDRALEWAARCPCASTGAAEVRPVTALPPDMAAPPRTLEEATHVLLIYANATADGPATEAEGDAVMHKYFAYSAALRQAKVYAGGDPLEPATTATTVRLRGGKRRVQDGPYADTKEELGGYYLFACKSDKDALAWAAKCPAVETGAVELRRVWPFPDASSYA